ncbi:MAG: hypothetical protein ACI9M3_001888 [Bacteroidia bacterium]|jgi:hypothetical protein
MKREKESKRGHAMGKKRVHGSCRTKRKPNSKYVKSGSLAR